MDYRKLYREKLISIEDAVAKVKSGDHIVTGLGCGGATAILEEMVTRKKELKDVVIHQMLPLYNYRYFQEGMEDSIRHNSWFNSPYTRKMVNDKRADFTPNFFHESPALFSNYHEINILIAAVSPMDRHGYFSFGLSVDYTKPVAEHADLVILEVNQAMPVHWGIPLSISVK